MILRKWFLYIYINRFYFRKIKIKQRLKNKSKCENRYDHSLNFDEKNTILWRHIVQDCFKSIWLRGICELLIGYSMSLARALFLSPQLTQCRVSDIFPELLNLFKSTGNCSQFVVRCDFNSRFSLTIPPNRKPLPQLALHFVTSAGGRIFLHNSQAESIERRDGGSALAQTTLIVVGTRGMAFVFGLINLFTSPWWITFIVKSRGGWWICLKC